MEERQQSECDPISYLIDSFWASMPEKTADELAKFKKDVLTGIKDAVAKVIDSELEWTDRHLENARRMREQYRKAGAEGPQSNPV